MLDTGSQFSWIYNGVYGGYGPSATQSLTAAPDPNIGTVQFWYGVGLGLVGDTVYDTVTMTGIAAVSRTGALGPPTSNVTTWAPLLVNEVGILGDAIFGMDMSYYNDLATMFGAQGGVNTTIFSVAGWNSSFQSVEPLIRSAAGVPTAALVMGRDAICPSVAAPAVPLQSYYTGTTRCVDTLPMVPALRQHDVGNAASNQT
jgi:hypothetical protein